MEDPGQPRLEGVCPIKERKSLGAGGNRELVRKAMLLVRKLDLEIGLKTCDERALTCGVVRLGMVDNALVARHATTSEVCP